MGVGGQAQVEGAAERVELDKERLPTSGCERGEGGGALACTGCALAADDGDHAARLRPGARGGWRRRGGRCGGRVVEGAAERVGAGFCVDRLVDGERAQRLPVVLVERDSDQAGPAGAGADTVGRRQAGEIGREQDRFGVGAKLVVEFVCLADRGERLDDRLRSEQERLDRSLGDRRQREHDRWPLGANGPASLAGGIGAARARPLSRSRSSLASELASASALASEGSGSASVIGTEAAALSLPLGAPPTESTSSPRAIALVRAWPLPLP